MQERFLSVPVNRGNSISKGALCSFRGCILSILAHHPISGVLTSAIRHQNSFLLLKSFFTPVPPYGSTFKYAIFLRHPNHLSQNHKMPCLSAFQEVGISRNVKTAEVRKYFHSYVVANLQIVFEITKSLPHNLYAGEIFKCPR